MTKMTEIEKAYREGFEMGYREGISFGHEHGRVEAEKLISGQVNGNWAWSTAKKWLDSNEQIVHQSTVTKENDKGKRQ